MTPSLIQPADQAVAALWAVATTMTPEELLALDAVLDDDERDTAHTVRQVLDARVRPHVAQWYLDGRLPAHELALELGTLGLLSLRASVTGQITLDGVRLPTSAVLPGVRGLKGPLVCLTEARFGIAWE